MSHFDITRALIVAALKRGIEVERRTRGHRGVVGVKRMADGATVLVTMRGGKPLSTYGVSDDSLFLAAEHFIALVGEKNARSAAEAAASGAWGCEAKLATLPSKYGPGYDGLFYAHMRWSGLSSPRWGFIHRLNCTDATGSTQTGADCIGPSEVDAVARWEAKCTEARIAIADSVCDAARPARNAAKEAS